MKTINWKKESLLWLVMILPLAYLALVWDSLPETIPTHFNAAGEPDGWGSRDTLIYISLFFGLGIYLLMSVFPAIDPKRKLEKMGKKYYILKFIMVLFMSLLACFITYSAKAEGFSGNLIYIIIGLLIAVLGNYFPSIKHNYFIGIRTPWTLESETIWKKTHRLAGRLWVPAGILISVMALLFDNMETYLIGFFVIIVIISIIPLVYSYLEFRREG